MVYIQIPKNASSSVTSVLTSSLLRSLPKRNFEVQKRRALRKYNTYLATLDPLLEEQKKEGYLIFAVVRDPLNRAVSFCMNKVVGRNKPPNTGDKRFYNGMGIEECLRTVALTKRKSDPHFRPQYHWLLQEDGTPRFNMLIKLESLNEEWNKIRQHAMETGNIRIRKMIHARSTKEKREGKPHEYFITPEVQNLLEIYYAKDIELLKEYFPELL